MIFLLVRKGNTNFRSSVGFGATLLCVVYSRWIRNVCRTCNLFKLVEAFTILCLIFLIFSVSHIFFLSLGSLFETTQTLFWAAFGLIDLTSFDLKGIKYFTRFWGMFMFGTYSVINVIVLLNLLIAMMNHSYQLVSVSSVSVQKPNSKFSGAQNGMRLSRDALLTDSAGSSLKFD